LSRDSEVRLFAAVELPGQLALGLLGWGREVAASLGSVGGRGGLRVLEPPSLHLTLCFLGARPAEEIDPLVAALAEACEGAPALELSLGGPVWLPPRRPRALAIEIHDATGSLASLQGAVERTLLAGGEGGNARHYRPHVTVARTRAGIGRPAGEMLPATPAESFEADRVALIRSWLEPKGARYEMQGSVALGPPGA
jgi:2'-5' RNA ligase